MPIEKIQMDLQIFYCIMTQSTAHS